MSVTYTEDHNEALREETFVPVYARTKASRGRKKSGVRSWMILAPIGVLVIGGVGVAMMMNQGDVAPAPLAEPAATAPVMPVTPAPMAMEPAPVDSAPAPVMREATPTPAPAPVRRAAPRVQAPAAAPAPRTVTPEPSPATSTLNSAPATPAPTITVAPTPAPVAPPPVIVVEPLG